MHRIPRAVVRARPRAPSPLGLRSRDPVRARENQPGLGQALPDNTLSFPCSPLFSLPQYLTDNPPPPGEKCGLVFAALPASLKHTASGFHQ